ncbi:sugar transporter [uncultured Tateyamaria sp.]|uniref:sugar transporter n=1 Tax=uncultured Tateyamaria sp. TaxID=455651 RepID=UPI002617F862|nr:sugar transporter [uncultured Tateyamaria sp.]
MSGSDKVVDMPAGQDADRAGRKPRTFRPGGGDPDISMDHDPSSHPASPASQGMDARGAGPQGPGPRPGAPQQTETVFRPGEMQSDVMPRRVIDQSVREQSNAGVAPPAHLRRHHWGVFFAMMLVVILPLLGTVGYLFGVAKDQYGSVTAFTVRQDEGGSASDLLGGLDLFAGAGGSSDTDILFEYIQSQELVEIIDARLDLRTHYEQHWDVDKVFSLWPEASIEDLVWFWSRVVRISYDQAAGLMEIEVRAFDPDYAQAVATEIVTESERMINELSATARDDATRYAQDDLDEALERLKTAREALTAFRTRSQIVDPEADIQGRMGVMNNLQQQLAEALIEADLLAQTSNANDPRTAQARRRIEVIRARIASERQAFAQGDDDVGALVGDYPSLISEFERLTVDREYAEETYRAALTALDVARANGIRRSRYLATYIEPTGAGSSEYPQRYILSALAGLFLLLTWAILALIYYSLRDRR